jgi:hypothetical protein
MLVRRSGTLQQVFDEDIPAQLHLHLVSTCGVQVGKSPPLNLTDHIERKA